MRQWLEDVEFSKPSLVPWTTAGAEGTALKGSNSDFRFRTECEQNHFANMTSIGSFNWKSYYNIYFVMCRANFISCRLKCTSQNQLWTSVKGVRKCTSLTSGLQLPVEVNLGFTVFIQTAILRIGAYILRYNYYSSVYSIISITSPSQKKKPDHVASILANVAPMLHWRHTHVAIHQYSFNNIFPDLFLVMQPV